MNILITGAIGLIGASITSHLTAAGHNIARMLYLPQHVWTPETLDMLLAGSGAVAAKTTALLGRSPIAVEQFVGHGQSI